MCFGQEEEHYHGTQYRHERCFVRGCTSPYRREGGWKSGVVEGHVKKWHAGIGVGGGVGMGQWG